MGKRWRRWWLTFLLVVLLLPTGCGALHGGKGLARIQDAGVLRVAMDPSFPPFESIDGSGEIVGLDVDIAKALGARLGVRVEFVTTTYDGLYDALVTGRADVIISALYPDPSRTEDFAFSSPYFNAGEVLIVPPDSPIQTLEDVGGRHILAVFGTDGHMEALRWQNIYNPPPQVTTAETEEEALAALLEGRCDGAIVSNLTALAAQMQGKPVRIVQPFVTDEIYVIAARREDADLIAALSQLLQQLAGDGTMDQLTRRWLLGGP